VKNMVKKMLGVWLVVSDLEKSISFYRDTLGLPLKSTEEGFADFKTKGAELALGTKEVIEKTIGQKAVIGGPRHLILAWDAVEDIDKLYEELKAKGVPFLGKPKTQPWGQRVAYFTDPDGHIWEISSWVKKE